MKIGNAPVSWGIFELEGVSADLPYGQVMDEIAESGYAGTELGPWNYYPTDPARLQLELNQRHLALASAFCPVDLTDPAKYGEAEAQALATSHLLHALGTRELIVADQWRPGRAMIAGRAGPADELAPQQWDAVASGLNRLGARLADDGMQVVFHHHVATYVETEAEINRLLTLTDPKLVGLCLDTGHAEFGGADSIRLFRRWRDRVHYLHLKDVDPVVLARVRQEKLGYDGCIRAGVFCPLGDGQVDFRTLFSELLAARYSGWLIVEQDVIVGASGERMTSLEAARHSRAFLRSLLGS
jgi:inosose dehydratase